MKECIITQNWWGLGKKREKRTAVTHSKTVDLNPNILVITLSLNGLYVNKRLM